MYLKSKIDIFLPELTGMLCTCASDMSIWCTSLAAITTLEIMPYIFIYYYYHHHHHHHIFYY